MATVHGEPITVKLLVTARISVCARKWFTQGGNGALVINKSHPNRARRIGGPIKMCLQNQNHPHFVLTEIPAMASRFSLRVELILQDVIIHVPVVAKPFCSKMNTA
jgi:hypothetical protein